MQPDGKRSEVGKWDFRMIVESLKSLWLEKKWK